MKIPPHMITSLQPNKYRDYKPINTTKTHPVQYLIFKKETFPFTPTYTQIIYVETHYNSFYNDYIQKNYDEIYTYFKEHYYIFCYIPQIKKDIANNVIDIISYRNPSINDFNENIDFGIDSSTILSYLRELQEVGPGFIKISKYQENNEDIIFTYYPLLPSEEVPMEQQIHDYSSTIYNIWITHQYDKSTDKNTRKPQFSYYRSDLDRNKYKKNDNNIDARNDIKLKFNDLADLCFSGEAHKLIDEIKERVDKLHQIGINEMLINKLFQPNDKLSRMVITSRYDIILPDYHDMKIEMTPLPKAVYFLFLRHPEGIPFKQLSDYKKELTAIYNKVSNRSIVEAMEKSIDDVVDPTSNSINEKCARIREAFISCFDERLANRYFVVGKRGEPKKVTLPRELITWEAPIE